MAKSTKPNDNGTLSVMGSSLGNSTEIKEKTSRRTLTVQYKRKILATVERCKKEGRNVGELLRSEGLYSGQVAKWRRDLNEISQGKEPRSRGAKPQSRKEIKSEMAKMASKIARLERQLAQAEAVIDIQKKVSSLIGLELPTVENDL